ncbi:MAG TPA: MFS transporter [Polyangiaceae bacterium]|nr:MFS transporter [Polyangiaceae bacterium]
MSESKRALTPWAWVPTSYLAEGIPFAMVIWVAGTMFKDLGHSDGEITLATASIGLAWSLKPLWAAFLDMYRTKKFFVLAMELFMAILLGIAALTLGLPNYFSVVIAILWVIAFSSATQDICVDGVYITALDKKGQAAFIGIQGVFWNVGRIFATAAVVWFAGTLKESGAAPKTAWTSGLLLAAAVMAALFAYHYFMLPTGSVTRSASQTSPEVPTSPALRGGVSVGVGAVVGAMVWIAAGPVMAAIIGIATAALITVGWRDHVPPFLAFIKKKHILGMLVFVFLYRAGEGFLLIEAPLFMQSPVAQGGLGLTLSQKALIDGTISTGVSLVAGILGGAFASKYGLKRTLLVLAICMNVPHLCYIYLSHAGSVAHPVSMTTIQLLVTIEKFGYSFGFVGNMLYMMQQIAPGKFKMTHYAYATSFMNLVLVPTQAASGPLADWLGYKNFFIFVMIASIPSIIAAWKAPFPNTPESGGTDGTEDAEAPAAAAA